MFPSSVRPPGLPARLGIEPADPVFRPRKSNAAGIGRDWLVKSFWSTTGAAPPDFGQLPGIASSGCWSNDQQSKRAWRQVLPVCIVFRRPLLPLFSLLVFSAQLWVIVRFVSQLSGLVSQAVVCDSLFFSFGRPYRPLVIHQFCFDSCACLQARSVDLSTAVRLCLSG